jgi:hypothetical protein
MGGSAVLIKGVADVERLQTRGLLARWLGRKNSREFQLGRDRRLVDLPSKNVSALGPEFKAYLRRKLPTPWPSSKAMLSYLDIALKVFVRGETHGDSAREWYIQLSFGGCAGMAQTSSEVAAHWAALWYAEESDHIARTLQGKGFTPTLLDGTGEELTFLPLGPYGYVSFLKAGYSLDPDEPTTHFELDAAVTDRNDDEAQPLLAALESGWVAFMSDSRCHCQLCDPGFDHRQLAELYPEQ